jgi:hypothetical protein
MIGLLISLMVQVIVLAIRLTIVLIVLMVRATVWTARAIGGPIP